MLGGASRRSFKWSGVARRKSGVAKCERPAHCSPYRRSGMDEEQKFDDLRTLARMAARLAGRDPDEHVEVKVGEVIAFSDAAWRYPDFINRAEAAYGILRSGAGF